jgi:hypothetical protein
MGDARLFDGGAREVRASLWSDVLRSVQIVEGLPVSEPLFATVNSDNRGVICSVVSLGAEHSIAHLHRLQL